MSEHVITYHPDKQSIEQNYQNLMSSMEDDIDAPTPSILDSVIDFVGKYYAIRFNSEKHGCAVIALMSEMALLSQYDKYLYEDNTPFNSCDYVPMMLEMEKYGDKLLLLMISGVKNNIDILTKNTSNISHLFYRVGFCPITDFEYRLPIIEAKMENPLIGKDFGERTNKLIQIYWDLLQKLENHLNVKVGKSDKHTWIVEHLSFQREKDDDDNPEWKALLQAFYKVRDEHIHHEESKKEDQQRQLNAIKEEKEKLEQALNPLQRKIEELTKTISKLEQNLNK